MSDDKREGQAFVAGSMCGAAVVAMAMMGITSCTRDHDQQSWQKAAIQHNAAHYDSVTAEFKWNTPAVEVVK